MLIAQNIGIDGSSKSFRVCFKTMDDTQKVKIKGSRTFDNNLKSFESFQQWFEKKRDKSVPLRFTMEATGVYYEQLAYYLDQAGYYVSVLLPNKAKAYFNTLNLKSKTDDLEAKALAQLGLERKLDQWKPLSKQMYKLKRLCRERVMLLEEKTMISNRLHAEQNCQSPDSSIIKRAKGRLKLLKKQVAEVEKQLEELTHKDELLFERVEKICQLKGLGFITVISVIAETNGFAMFTSRGQLTSFAGYDVVERQSGTSVLGKTKISKKGNRYIRRALHLPSLSVIRYNDEFKNLYLRIYDRTKIKMKGIVAVQRKLLLLIFTLFKKNQAYDSTFKQNLTLNNGRQDTSPAYSG